MTEHFTHEEFLDALENYFNNILMFHPGDDPRVKKDDICLFMLAKIKEFRLGLLTKDHAKACEEAEIDAEINEALAAVKKK